MCENAKANTVQQAKAEFYEAKQALHETLQRGDESLCEYLKHILTPKNSHKTPTDGNKYKGNK